MRRLFVIFVWLVLLIALDEASNGAYSLFYELYLTPSEKVLEVPTWYYLVLSGIDLALFFASAVLLGRLSKTAYPALLAAIGLAQTHLFLGLLLGSVWRFNTGDPSVFEFVVIWSPFFVPTIGAIAGSLVAKAIWSEERASTIA